jgi:ABC-type ATPase with predicted acetyltransferase domain
MYDYTSQQHRLTDADIADFARTDRIFNRTGLWYFRTREGNDVGPFRYKDEAELMLTKFVQELQQIQQDAMVSTKPHFRVSGVLGRRQQS